MHHTVFGQDFYRFRPRRMNCFVFGIGYGKQFGQFHTVGYRYIRVFTDNTVVFDRQQRKLTFDSRRFHYITHTLPPFFSV